MRKILETERLYLREMTQEDYPALSDILQDADVMYAYNGPFSAERTQNWLNNQLARYARDGFGLWAVVSRETGVMLGQCGLTYQVWKDRTVLEVGYLFRKAFWHKGYAAEAARACRDYAFNVLGAREVFSIIRDTNIPSQHVAMRNGMTLTDDNFSKSLGGEDVPHLLFSVKRNG